MTPINEIDPLSQTINSTRALELDSVVRAFSEMAALTVRQERDLLRLLTSAYLAGREDGQQL